MSLSADGNTLAVGAKFEDSESRGINKAHLDNLALNSGAVYVFTRNAGVWAQQAFIKASNSTAGIFFGVSVNLSSDGNTLGVGARLESSNATGINGDQLNTLAPKSGAVYVFTRTQTLWTQQAYVKASNTEADDNFGKSISISSDGNTLVVGAHQESSNSTGVNADQFNNNKAGSGAVYVFTRSGITWKQDAYIKASNTDANDKFGINVALSGDGNILAVGATGETSGSKGVNGTQGNDIPKKTIGAGAAYVFQRRNNSWMQKSYVKSPNPDAEDAFGGPAVLNHDGSTLIVGSRNESSNALGFNGNLTDNSAPSSGAIYIY